MDLLLEARPLIDRLSGDRVRHELNHIFNTQVVCQILARLDSLGMLSAIHPGLVWDDWLSNHLKALQRCEPADIVEFCDADRSGNGMANGHANGHTAFKRDMSYLLWLIRLPAEDAEQVCARLKLPVNLVSAIQHAHALWEGRADWSAMPPSGIVRRLEDVPCLAWYAVYLAADDASLRQSLEAYFRRWRNISPTIDGNDLKALGLRPSAVYRHILSALRSAWIDGEVTTPEQEKALLERLLLESKVNGDQSE